QDGWTRNDGEQWISLQLERDAERQFGFSVPARELEGLGMRGTSWTASDVRFTVRRDAGNIALQGSFVDGRGAGTWQFTPNGEFVAALQKTYSPPAPEPGLKLAIVDVPRSFIASMQAEGYTAVGLDDLTKMRI